MKTILNSFILITGFVLLTSADGCMIKLNDTTGPQIINGTMQMVNFGNQRAIKVHVEAVEPGHGQGIYEYRYSLKKRNNSSANANDPNGPSDFGNLVVVATNPRPFAIDETFYLPMDGSASEFPIAPGVYDYRITLGDYVGNWSNKDGQILVQ